MFLRLLKLKALHYQRRHLRRSKKKIKEPQAVHRYTKDLSWRKSLFRTTKPKSQLTNKNRFSLTFQYDTKTSLDRFFFVTTDADDDGEGGVLGQQDEGRDERVI